MKAKCLVVGLLAALGLVLSACGADEDPAWDLYTERGGPVVETGKADGTLSCKGNCGKQAPGGCWCDKLCAVYGDCCKDKDTECGTSTKSECVQKGGYCTHFLSTCKQGYTGGPGLGCPMGKSAQCCLPAATTTCTGNKDCQSTEYCHFADGDCTKQTLTILTGTCKTRPQVCYELYAPVCGCDGKTYGNDCKAHGAGTSIAYQGKCKTTPAKCGPWLGGQCASGEVCDIQSCALGGSGTCVKQPKPSQCYDYMYKLAQPVCGCDGKTYGNDCLRLAAGVALDYKGPCKSKCWGAWLDQYGNCRTPADGVYPDACCKDELYKKCTAIDQKYAKAVEAAKACSPWPTFAPQCTNLVAESLVPCSSTCWTYINSSPTTLKTYSDEWKQYKCDTKVSWICKMYFCPKPTGATCKLGLYNNASCVDL